MQSLAYIPASNQAVNASVMTVQNIRSPGASTIITNTVAGAPAKFYASMGTPHTFTDPVTGETITVISEASAVDFAGHLDTGHVEIDAIAPGYTDLGSKVGDIIIIRPVTEWANNIFNLLSQSHNDNGTIKNAAISADTMFVDAVNPVKRTADFGMNYVVSGCKWTADAAGSTRAATMSAGIVVINGKRLTVAGVTARLFTASKDTYVDLQDAGNGTATPNYTEVTNNANSPIIPNSLVTATNLRDGIIVTGASNIAAQASINQGQISALLPSTSGVGLGVCDTLGNLIYPRPGQKIIGHRAYPIGGGPSSSSTSIVAINAGMNMPVLAANVPTGKIRASLVSRLASGPAGGWEILIALGAAAAVNAFTDFAPALTNMPLNLSGVTDLTSDNTIYPGYSTSSGSVGIQAFNSGFYHTVEIE